MAAKTVSNSNSHIAMPAHITPSPTLSKRGHIRSASLENANSFVTKNALGLPAALQAGHTGTLKSRNEQKRMRNKFGSHSNLEDYVQHGRTKFQNLRQMFEISKSAAAAAKNNGEPVNTNSSSSSNGSTDKEASEMLQSLPVTIATATQATTANVATYQQQNKLAITTQTQQRPQAYTQQQIPHHPTQQQNQNNPQNQQQQKQAQLQAAYQQQCAAMQQQQQQHQQQQQQLQLQNQQQQTQLTRKATPTTVVNGNGCGNRNSISELSERLNIIECLDVNNKIRQQQQQQQQQQSQRQQHLQQTLQLAQQQQQQQQRCASDLANLQHEAENNDQATNLLRPIAFKPIPFEPDYSIPNRYCDVVGDRYGSTPSLAPAQGSNLRFGSTTDLRYGGGGGGSSSASIIGGGIGAGSVGGFVGGYSSSNNYCNSLLARRRGSRSLKINDSMESIRHTPDSDANSQSSAFKMSGSMHNSNNTTNNNSSNNSNKYIISEQCDMTPSPSDSGISELEDKLKDRDSELSYLRQTMEHNEKDKEAFWESETKRLKSFYEGQQRECLLKMKKMEQMLAMQQFQFKQHKLRHTDQSNKLREQMADLKNENEILRSNNISLKNSERNLKDRVAYIEEQLRESQNMLIDMRAQLEESEWKVCERNGELALLKSQLKEANVEITMKEHAIVHLKHENTNAETQIYQSLQENQKITQQQKQVEELKAQSEKETETELKQLNKIIILKDQVILALTNELAKLRKELSDLVISHEYGEEPSGKYIRLKQQLDNLSDICNKTRKHTLRSEVNRGSKEKVIDDTNLEVILNCLKIAPPLDIDHSDNSDENNTEKRLAKMSADIQKFVYGSQNLPDVAVNVQTTKFNTQKLEESTLDTLIEESANYAEEIAKLRKQLDDVRENFELEKRQWCVEREKVLNYQKQLQVHYINMYQKLRSLESSNEF
ncbi:putative uncharacterized protein DDB_G0271606 isoform X2 [Teleopsis dalmanni]|uniref:putative uncharacterized protein DDB_G0271606 isoform X2 n=1 Tax=Teleopsis dalmanni TaxID=139649 RepID=UPI0018CE989A|nr:putative uncharacterized protein DDB_G0271606 isoform X2 [Teleopsis dalmanni]